MKKKKIGRGEINALGSQQVGLMINKSENVTKYQICFLIKAHEKTTEKRRK